MSCTVHIAGNGRRAGLSLIANTAPVAFGALGTPIIALSKVTGIDELVLSQMVGRQLPFFSLIVPFWVVWAQAGFRGMVGVWPAALTAGLAFAVPQFLVSNFHGPWLVDIVASLSSIGAVVVLLKFWQPKDNWKPADEPERRSPTGQDVPAPATNAGLETGAPSAQLIRRAWTPWILLSLLVFLWGIPQTKQFLNGTKSLFAALTEIEWKGIGFKLITPQFFDQLKIPSKVTAPEFPVSNLHNVVLRAPPVAPANAPPEKALFTFNWLSATGTGILASAILAGFIMGFPPGGLARVYWQTFFRVRYSLITIAAMLALGYVTKYSGTDATLGLALAKTGVLYPFFGTLLGWLGVALTGSDTASNVLFGSLQKITAEQTGLSPTLMAAANSSGGVMGKMVDAQSIVVASTATNWYGHEGAILRYVFFHSIALAALVGLLVYLQAYVPPFTSMVVR